MLVPRPLKILIHEDEHDDEYEKNKSTNFLGFFSCFRDYLFIFLPQTSVSVCVFLWLIIFFFSRFRTFVIDLFIFNNPNVCVCPCVSVANHFLFRTFVLS